MMMEQGQAWKIRDGNEEDMEEILSLRKIVFGDMENDKLRPEFWKWEFMKGPDGKAFVCIVEEGKKIIGHFADIPKRFSIEGRVTLGTLSLDLMVHPDNRRRGIFEEMGRYSVQRVKKEGGLFLTAYPIREETIRGLRKIGWKDVVKLPVLVYPIRFPGIFNRFIHFSPLSFILGNVAKFFHSLIFQRKLRSKDKEILVEKVVDLDDKFDAFWQRALNLYPILSVRDRNCLTWRYFLNPTRSYTIYRALKRGETKGYIALRKVDLLGFNSAAIVDLLVLDEEVLMALVEKGIEHSRQEGADLLGFMVPRTHPYHQFLRRNGFLPSLKTFNFMVYVHGREEILLNPRAWYVNWGDSDVI